MRKWKRLGAQPIYVYGTAAFTTVVVLIAVFVLFAGKPVDGQQRTTFMIVGFLLVLALFAWGLNRMGLYISDEAVRRIYLFWWKTVPWSEVAAVGVEGMKMAQFGRLDEICVELKNGEIMGTGVFYRDSMNSFLSIEPGTATENVTSIVAAGRGRDVLMTLQAAHRKAR